MNDRTIFGQAVFAILRKSKREATLPTKPTQSCFTFAFALTHQRHHNIKMPLLYLQKNFQRKIFITFDNSNNLVNDKK